MSLIVQQTAKDSRASVYSGETESLLKRAFTEAEAANYIAMSQSFLRQARMNGVRENRTPGPKWIKIGRSVRYLIEDLDEWLEQYRQEPNKGEE